MNWIKLLSHVPAIRNQIAEEIQEITIWKGDQNELLNCRK
jgi:hypothetical protein